jgi:C-terminal processing protease CtpA/Prc
MAKKKEKNPERRFKRRYRFFQCGFIFLVLFLGLVFYWNYDYWAFKVLIADNYIFTDTLTDVYHNAVGAENFMGFRPDFDRFVIAAVTEKIRAANGDRYTYLYTPQQYTYAQQAEKEDAKYAFAEGLDVDTALMYLPNISAGTREFVYNQREQLAGYKNLILDLRGNYGGLLNDFYRVADLFIEKGAVLGYERTRFPVWPFRTHAVKAGHESYFDFENILILQDRNTASASEGMILALKQNVKNVVTMGEKSFGKGIGQVDIPLTGGYAVRATVMQVEGPDGHSIHQIGIVPDIVLSEAELADDDTVIERALEYLAQPPA